MVCENCGKEHDGSFGSGRFCSRKCCSVFCRKIGSQRGSKATKEKWNQIWEIRLNKVLSNESDISIIKRKNLKDLLIEFNLKEHKCECCGRKLWRGKKIPIQLHHIDGNHTNNLLENLQILCPNCHAQTDTYGFRNMSRKLAKK